MPAAVFVSDVHIASPDSERSELFTRFLESLSYEAGVRHLCLLGDIFDLWVADHGYFVDRYARIIGEVRRLKEEGVEVSYFEGNHDLYLRHFWERKLGVTVHGGPAMVRFGDRLVRLEHGDQMDPDDRGYLFLRWFLRTPPIHFLNRSLPGSLIRRIGERASASSRHYTSNTKTIDSSDAVRKIREHAEKVHAEDPFDLIISGHVHIRDDCELESGNGRFRSVNLGSWYDRPCYFRLGYGTLGDDDARFVELGDDASTADSGTEARRTAS
jgi:UDP-2,3-diacylglucosamine hydrolase